MGVKQEILNGSDAGLSIHSVNDIPDVLGACFGVDGLLLQEDNLGPAFFDLKSGLAGELLQKFVNYRLRVALVVPDPAAYGERFRELAHEHRSHRLIRFVRSREEAERWLVTSAGKNC